MPPKLPTHPRSRGSCYDTPPLVFPIQSLHDMHNTADTTFSIKQREDKLPHDASVFVGSLPSNIEQMDLSRMLMEHLSEHTQIKNVKVVRDSKGGVCAFVQCENATSAAALIQTLHSSPSKPFLGRILRYEPARAFRTLLVSYRTPTRLASHGNVNDASDKPVPNAEIELELPDVMRIWKQRHSRFHSILYNSEAIEAQENNDLDDPFVADNVVFLRPLAFNAEALRTIASYFGRLESFIPLETSKNDRDDGEQKSDNENPVVEYALYPAPHNAPRSPGMDDTCWEIKWEHRDDCVSALMTLRRVPHLTVTWAHQPVLSDHSNHHQGSGFASYPLHVQDYSISAQQSPASPTSMNNSGNNTSNVVHQPVRRHIECNTLQGGVSGFKEDLNTTGFGHEAHNSPTAHPDAGYLGCDTTHWMKHSPITPSHLSVINRAESDSGDEEQELFIPQTPALDTSSITPVTPGQFPITPTSCDDNLQQSMRPKTLGEKEYPIINRSDRELDPTTLFVGGLEMFGPGAWDEEKVTKFFARFGGLESVKVVRPLNSCSAFAFVKFNNAESPARAVFEEHNRVYEGRAMRVQLRDCNPPRSPWKYVRGRGRPQAHVGIQRRLNYKPTFDGQDKNIRRDRITSFKGPETDDGGEIQLSSLVLPRTQKHSNADMALPSGTVLASSPELTSNANTTPQENYREWYDELESPTHTPAPSSLASSISTNGTSLSASPYPYPLPNRQFYPTPWMHPFMPQLPYHVPYYGNYPIYPGVAQNPTQSSPPGADTSGPTAVPHWPYMSMYGSYIPYPVIPPRTHDTVPGPSQHLNGQAPLVPTGFIQNEHGTLVAVYHPEALDQYLTRTQGPPATLATPANIGTQRWIPYTGHPYEPDSSVASLPRTTQATNPGQMRNLASLPAARPQQFSDFQRSYPPFRAGDGTSNPLSLRHGGRRELQAPFTPGRSNPRLFGGRTFRPGPAMQNSGQIYPPEMRQQSSSAPMIADWSKWNVGR